jgi:hypothetical protein
MFLVSSCFKGFQKKESVVMEMKEMDRTKISNRIHSSNLGQAGWESEISYPGRTMISGGSGSYHDIITLGYLGF